jgi:DNA-binding Xre family transcriptional regulator
MIVFDKLWTLMEEKGITKYRLRENCDLGGKCISRLMRNASTTTYTLDKICNYLDCNLEDIATHIKEEPLK